MTNTTYLLNSSCIDTFGLFMNPVSGAFLWRMQHTESEFHDKIDIMHLFLSWVINISLYQIYILMSGLTPQILCTLYWFRFRFPTGLQYMDKPFAVSTWTNLLLSVHGQTLWYQYMDKPFGISTWTNLKETKLSA